MVSVASAVTSFKQLSAIHIFFPIFSLSDISIESSAYLLAPPRPIRLATPMKAKVAHSRETLVGETRTEAYLGQIICCFHIRPGPVYPLSLATDYSARRFLSRHWFDLRRTRKRWVSVIGRGEGTIQFGGEDELVRVRECVRIKSSHWKRLVARILEVVKYER